MKRILLLSAVLLGAVTASQAGVRFSIGIPAPPVIVAPPAPVYVQPPAETYVEPPPVYAPAPPIVVAPPVFDFRFGDRRPIYRSYPYRPYYHDWHHDRDYHHDHDWDHHRR